MNRNRQAWNPKWAESEHACMCVYLRSGMDWEGRRSWWTVDGCAVPARPPGTDPVAGPGVGPGTTWSDEGERHWGQTHDGCTSSCRREARPWSTPLFHPIFNTVIYHNLLTTKITHAPFATNLTMQTYH